MIESSSDTVLSVPHCKPTLRGCHLRVNLITKFKAVTFIVTCDSVKGLPRLLNIGEISVNPQVGLSTRCHYLFGAITRRYI